jgi:zinc transport system substrate-binding protein
MIRIASAAFAALLTLTSAAQAAPKVATDIPPVQSLVARVMAGVGAPELVVPPGASPHAYAMRPSEARKLAGADAVFWIGDALAPWFGETLAALAPDAETVALMDVPGVTLLDAREGATFEAHEEDRAHDAHDEHVWLDPVNARLWLGVIAATLSHVDPANAATYAANAKAGQAELDALMSEVDALLAPVRGKGYVVFHDAYQYFEARFAVPAAGAIAIGDAAQPSAARVAAIRATISRLGAACVFSEPQFEPRLVATVIAGTNARAGVLDPLGASLAVGPDLYQAMIRNLARPLADCLGASPAD